MAARRPRQAPRLPPTLEPVANLVLRPGVELSGADITGIEGGADASGIVLSECRVTGVRMIGTDLSRARFADTTFVRCDLSAAVLFEATMIRTVFVDCRLAGASLSCAELRDVSFEQCPMSGVELRMARTEQLEAVDCDLSDADFYAATLPSARLINCDLSRAECSQSSWVGAYLHGSKLEGTRGGGALRGVTIGSDQIVPLATAVFATLDITVDDDPPA